MKIKRYFAPDIRQAMRLVREEQGPDAVILSNRTVDGGVEIIAARDFDEEVVTPTVASTPPPAPERERPPLTESQRRAEEVFREALLGSGLASAATADRLQESPMRLSSGSHENNLTSLAAERPMAANRSTAKATGNPPPSSLSASRAGKPTPRQSPLTTPSQTSQTQAGAARTGVRPPTSSAEAYFSAHGRALQALQKEIQSLRRTLDGHFAETAWNNLVHTAPTRLDLLRRLNLLGFTRRISLQIANRLGGIEDFDLAWQGCQDLLAGQLPVVDDNLLDYGGIVALVGPTGVGKTTTLAKIAARFRIKHGPRKLALITTDNHRIAAHEQLSTYGRLLDVPVRAVANADELRHALSEFYDKRLVLIDTAGMGPRDDRLAEQFATLNHEDMPIRTYLVLSAASQVRALQTALEAYAGFAPNACILTKLDETETLGGALSILIERQLPISLYTDGQQVPEDLHQARTHLLLERCLQALTEEAEEEFSVGGAYAYEEWVSRAHV